MICRKSYAAAASYPTFYGGGDVSWSSDGQQLYCLNSVEVNSVDITTGQITHQYTVNSSKDKHDKDHIEHDIIYCFAVSAECLVTAHQSGLLHLWNLQTKNLVKFWKSQHKGPVTKLAFNGNGKLVCSSGTDSTLRIWDLVKNSCICMLNEYPGPAMIVIFHPNVLINEIYAVAADNSVYCWNFKPKDLKRKLRGHLSTITALEFQKIEQNIFNLITVSRDKVMIIWRLDTNDSRQLKVLPLYEELAGVTHILEWNAYLVANCNGKLQTVDTNSTEIKALSAQSDSEINKVLLCPDSTKLAVVSTDHNILIYNICQTENPKVDCIKQLIGNNDEILDMCFVGSEDRYLAVATNSKNFKLYDTQDHMNCKIIVGHKDTVMSISSAHNLIISAGKDCTIKVWSVNSQNFTFICLSTQSNCHLSTIGCVAFAHDNPDQFASVCQDGSMKVWQLKKTEQEYLFSVRYAILAHDKEINCINYSPNNKIIATASQDKTTKLWHCDKNLCIGVLRGHTRGVWCVRFSPVDQIALTCSSDCSIRIWSLSNFTCLKRLEQECTILCVEFIDHGKFIISSASDGLIKLWDIKANTSLQSIDEHHDRVWSLAVPTNTNKYFYSGGADSKIVQFTDITQLTRTEIANKRQTNIEEENRLQLLLHQQKHLEKAFTLALSLDKPKASYEIINTFVRQRDNLAINSIVKSLNNDQLVTLLDHIKKWSTNSRYSQVSNLILQQILTETLVKRPPNLYKSNLIEVILLYLQRYFNRATELNKDLAFLEFILECM